MKQKELIIILVDERIFSLVDELNEQTLPICHLRTSNIHTLCLFAVYCTCLLGSHAVPYAVEWNPDPLFSVNVTDIPNLISKSRYVACKYYLILTLL